MKLIGQDGHEIFDFGDDQTGLGLVSLLITTSKFQDGGSDTITHNPQINDLYRAVHPGIGPGTPISDDQFDADAFFAIRKSILFQTVGRFLAGKLSDEERDALIETSFFPARLSAAQTDRVRAEMADAIAAYRATRTQQDEDD